jgi:hypothetical protein
MRARWSALLFSMAISAVLLGEDSPSVDNVLPFHGHRATYAANGIVIEARGGDAHLCLGGYQPMLPPACGGLPITNWSWDQAKGEQSLAGVTWGSYRVVGTYDGKAFTLTEPPSIPEPRTIFDDEPPPCPTPGVSSSSVEGSGANEGHLSTAVAFARQLPGFAGLWIGEGRLLNVAFTDALDRREVEIRERWSGPLRIFRHARTLRELRAIQAQFSSGVRPFGFDVLLVSVSEPRNHVLVYAVLADDPTRSAIEARYGREAVVVKSALVPL